MNLCDSNGQLFIQSTIYDNCSKIRVKMCGTNIIDHIFFPGLIVSIMVAFMDPKLVIIEGDGDGWSSIYHSVC